VLVEFCFVFVHIGQSTVLIVFRTFTVLLHQCHEIDKYNSYSYPSAEEISLNIASLDGTHSTGSINMSCEMICGIY
jgi:hypothetical protein